jgi:hypothetical protein
MTDQIHETCTSTPLDSTDGSAPERINANTLNKIYEKLYGTSVSSDPVVARIQREQALVRHKRQGRI